MRKICFIISSYIYPDNKSFYNGGVRSVFSPEERIVQSKSTIESIRKQVKDAYIIMTDNSRENPEIHFKDIVDEFHYIGNHKIARKAASFKNKGLGEAVLMLYSLPYCRTFDYIFKISGRYYLNAEFDLEKFSNDEINFKHNTVSYKDITSKRKYIYGSHNMVLYGFPSKLYNRFYLALICSIPILLTPRSIELVLPYMFRRPIYYIEKCGVSGIVSGDEKKRIYSC